eukprot:TRINITY_DN16156_c0_g1_i1.p1 TRINITY_DN16156_c0_g1~~TRINITY_DN16156_c0_g1_i1.p1  ORF type:complete len:152 (-),score=29.80 TRINITY_DN16156_c0_g1_i1:115-570(-)
MMRVHLQQLQSALVPPRAPPRLPDDPLPEPLGGAPAVAATSAAAPAWAVQEPLERAAGSPVPPPIAAEPLPEQYEAAPPPQLPPPRHLFTTTLSHLQSIPHTTRLLVEPHQSPALLAERAQATAARRQRPQTHADFRSILQRLQPPTGQPF